MAVSGTLKNTSILILELWSSNLHSGSRTETITEKKILEELISVDTSLQPVNCQNFSTELSSWARTMLVGHVSESTWGLFPHSACIWPVHNSWETAELSTMIYDANCLCCVDLKHKRLTSWFRLSILFPIIVRMMLLAANTGDRNRFHSFLYGVEPHKYHQSLVTGSENSIVWGQIYK